MNVEGQLCNLPTKTQTYTLPPSFFHIRPPFPQTLTILLRLRPPSLNPASSSSDGEQQRRSSGVVLPPQISSLFSPFIPHTSLFFFFLRRPRRRMTAEKGKLSPFLVFFNLVLPFKVCSSSFFLFFRLLILPRCPPVCSGELKADGGGGDLQWSMEVGIQAQVYPFIAIFLWFCVRLRDFEFGGQGFEL